MKLLPPSHRNRWSWQRLLPYMLRRKLPTGFFGNSAMEESGESGSLLVETALALTVAFPVVMWMFELCMISYTYSVLGDAARQGVRYAAIHGTDSALCSGPSSGCGDSSAANVVTQVKSYAANTYRNISGMTVTVTYPDGSSAPSSRVLVSISYTYVPSFQLAGMTPTMTLSSEGRIVY